MKRSEFAGFARFGFVKSQHRCIYGVRLVLVADSRSLPLGYTVVAAKEKEQRRAVGGETRLVGAAPRSPCQRDNRGGGPGQQVGDRLVLVL